MCQWRSANGKYDLKWNVAGDTVTFNLEQTGLHDNMWTGVGFGDEMVS